MRKLLIASMILVLLVAVALSVGSSEDAPKPEAPQPAEISEPLSASEARQLARERMAAPFWLGPPAKGEQLRADLSPDQPGGVALGYLSPDAQSARGDDPLADTYLIVSQPLEGKRERRQALAAMDEAGAERIGGRGFSAYLQPSANGKTVRQIFIFSDEGRSQAVIFSKAADASPEAARELAARIELID